MNRLLLSTLTLALCVAIAAAQDEKKDDEAKKEMEKLQGTWKTESVETAAKKVLSAEFGESQLVVKDDKYTFTMPDEINVNGMLRKIIAKEDGTLKVDPTKKPKTMDVIVTEGEAKGKTQLGVYELEGDSLKVTVNEPGDQVRPKEMGKGVITFVFKKEKK